MVGNKILNGVLLSAVVLVISQINAQAQQNVMTANDYGTFEAAGSESHFNTVNGGPIGVRSNLFAHSGNYSLKFESNSLDTYKIPIIPNRADAYTCSPGKIYNISGWFYIPSVINGQQNAIDGADVKAMFHGSESATAFCNWYADAGPTLDRWVYMASTTFYVAGTVDVHFYIAQRNPSAPFAVTTFFVDDLALREYSPISANGVVQGNNITLSPTGGVPDKNGVISYYYYWDDGSTEKNRVGVSGKRTVRIAYASTGNYGCDPTFTFYVSPCVASKSICPGISTQLTASCAPDGALYEWYDAPVGGNLLAVGETLNVGPKTELGVYKYYVLYNKNGSRSARSEATVTVTGPTPGLTVTPAAIYKMRPFKIMATTPEGDYKYEYTFPGESPFTTNETEIVRTYTDAGSYMVTCKVTSQGTGCSALYTLNVVVNDYIPLCETIVPVSSDNVLLDKFSGQYVFRRNANCAVDIDFSCIQGKIDLPLFDRVISASASTFSDDWTYDYTSTAASGENRVTNAEVGKWRTKATYTYKTDAVKVDMNYNSGTYQLPKFNWQHANAAIRQGWLKVTEIERYLQHGEAVQERNVLGIATAAKFGYDNALPYLVANNAEYDDVFFESFEKTYGTGTSKMLEDNTPLTEGAQISVTAHAGRNSLQMAQRFSTRPFTGARLLQKGMLVRFWVKGNSPATSLKLLVESTTATELLNTEIKLVARSSDWALCEARVTPNSFALPSNKMFKISLIKTSPEAILIDDVRVQPLDADVTCYVYDPGTLRLLATLDDQHFGLFYQYNMEGQLVRKMIETERGVKTVQETQYNIPEVSKD